MDQESMEQHESRKRLLTNLLVILVLVGIGFLSIGVIEGLFGIVAGIAALLSGRLA